MILIATKNSTYIKPGEVFECNAVLAQTLISKGSAKEYKPKEQQEDEKTDSLPHAAGQRGRKRTERT